MNRRIIALASGIFLCFAFVVQPILSKDIPNFTTRVLDETNTLEPETITAIEEISKEIEDKTTAQVIVYVTSSLEGEILEEYSIKVAESNGIGQKSKDNGVLVLIVIKDRKMRIEVGYGLEETLTDIYSNRITQNIFIPNFKAGDYNSGILQGVEAIRDILYGDAESNPNLYLSEEENSQGESGSWNEINESSYIQLLASFGFILALAIIRFASSDKLVWRKSIFFSILLVLVFISLVYFFTPKAFVLYPFLIYLIAFGYTLIFFPDEKPKKRKNSKSSSQSKEYKNYKYKHILTVIAHLILFSGWMLVKTSLNISLLLTFGAFIIFLFLNYPIAKNIEKFYKLTFSMLSFKDTSFKATKGYFFSFLLVLAFITFIVLGYDIVILLYIFSLIAIAFYAIFWVKNLRTGIYFFILYAGWMSIYAFYSHLRFPNPDELTGKDLVSVTVAYYIYAVFHFSLTLILVHRFIESKNNWIRLRKYALIALSWTSIQLIFNYYFGGTIKSLLIFPVYIIACYILKFLYEVVTDDSYTSGSSSSGSSYSSSSSSSYSSSSSSSSYSSGGGSFGGGGSSGSW